LIENPNLIIEIGGHTDIKELKNTIYYLVKKELKQFMIT